MTTPLRRFVSIEHNCGHTVALTEEEFAAIGGDVDNVGTESGVANWVWQLARDAPEAAAQHVQKIEAWEADPSLETY